MTTLHATRGGITGRARRPLRRRAAAGALALGLALGAVPPATAAGPPAPNAELASANAVAGALARHPLRGADGRTFTLASLHGEVVVVNFWASWCAPCRKELPALDALHGELSRQGGRVVAVSIDTDPENASDFARVHRLHLPIVHDGPDGLARELDLRHVPFTVVLDRDGAVAMTASGAGDDVVRRVAETARRLAARPPVVSGVVQGGTP